MTEVEIMNSLMFCEHGDCANCTRGEDDKILCMRCLMQDARKVIKMQIASLEAGANAIRDLERDNRQLQAVARYKFTEKELVDAVNVIIRYCLENDEDAEGNEFVNIIYSMLSFTELLPSKHKVTLFHGRKAPRIEKC